MKGGREGGARSDPVPGFKQERAKVTITFVSDNHICIFQRVGRHPSKGISLAGMQRDRLEMLMSELCCIYGFENYQHVNHN